MALVHIGICAYLVCLSLVGKAFPVQVKAL